MERMTRKALVLVLVLALGGILAGCSSAVEEEEGPRPISRARVMGINTDSSIIMLKHEEIPGVMMAMTMPFLVPDLAMLEGVSAGDAVEFEVEQQGSNLVIIAIKKIDPSELDVSNTSSYEGEAEVIVVNPAIGTIMVRATNVPGISGDGALVYGVRPASLLEGISDGDKVEIKLEDDGNANGQLVVTHLKKIG